jgi:hypothetical protein
VIIIHGLMIIIIRIHGLMVPTQSGTSALMCADGIGISNRDATDIDGTVLIGIVDNPGSGRTDGPGVNARLGGNARHKSH